MIFFALALCMAMPALMLLARSEPRQHYGLPPIYARVTAAIMFLMFGPAVGTGLAALVMLDPSIINPANWESAAWGLMSWWAWMTAYIGYRRYILHNWGDA